MKHKLTHSGAAHILPKGAVDRLHQTAQAAKKMPDGLDRYEFVTRETDDVVIQYPDFFRPAMIREARGRQAKGG